MLPTDNEERKALPVYTFLTKYFPLAFLEVVRVAVAGDKQHLNNSEPGEIRWAREKSTDQLNTALRHIMDYGMGEAIDTDGRAHLAKAIWRLSAQLQLDEEERLGITLGGLFTAKYTWKTDVLTSTLNTDPRFQEPTFEQLMRGGSGSQSTATETSIRAECAPDPQPDVCVVCPHQRVLHVKYPKPPRDRLKCADCHETLDPATVKIKPVSWPKPARICTDCGADLEEGLHAALCMLNSPAI